MLRVFGVTYDHNVNYGSNLQAYALQTVIEQMQIGDEMCSYRLIPVQNMKDYPRGSGIRHLLVAPLLALHKTQFVSFRKEYMKYADCDRLADLPGLNGQADAFVCGSDVVWSRQFNHSLGVFYLDFTDKYKFSYAASFGRADADPGDEALLRKRLGALREISVRETSGAAIAGQYTDRPVSVVLDPVLLLSAADWQKVCAPAKKRKPYIFAYATHITPTYLALLDRLRRQTGFPVVASAFGPEQVVRQKILQVQSPERWLQLLRDAAYVVTNSFHATAFSIIFHKKFFTVSQGDASAGVYVRMYDFLKSIGMEDRMVGNVPEKLSLETPDYAGADERLDEARSQSLQFLRRNLENALGEKSAHNTKKTGE